MITSKNSWELLLSSIAGAFDGADTFVLGTFDEAENYRYKTRITNLRTKQEISPFVTQIKLSIPDSSDKISTVKASFSLDEKVVQTGDEITIEVLNGSESAQLTILYGTAKITNRNMHMLSTNIYNVEILDEFDKLFEKVVAENVFLFDKYIYSEQYKENSILYIVAKKLGFTDEQMNFEDVRDSQSRLVKIPFMLLRKDNRYIDELQTILDVSKGRMYIDNSKQIIFKNGLFEYEKVIAYTFDKRNILRAIDENYKYTEKNGVRVTYDSYKNLANQVIFDLANKVEVAPGTTTATAKELGIKFITDLATQHNITKAEGYYYENEEQIRIPLLLGINYELIEFSETSAKVKFLNPYTTKFYIDKFEIKGIPLAMFSDNEVSVKATKDMLENEENFSSYNKNKYIQTEELASDIARVEYIRNCKNKKEYSFKSNFVPHLEPGDICTLKINDIDTLIQISTIEHTLSRVNGFYSEIVALEYEKIEQKFNYSKIESLTAKDSFLGTLNNIKDQVDETDKKLEEVILIEGARGFVSETDPILEREIKEPDVWFHPGTKEFKVWRNGKWNPAREEDIPPALMTALKAQAGIFRIGGNDTEAGIFFQYDKDKKNPVFGAIDPENLAQVSIDKEANVLIRNANNKLAFNMRNPENPSEIISQLLMGVYNADDTERHKNTLFQVGDESTGSYIKFERGKLTNVIDGKTIEEQLQELRNNNWSNGKMLYLDPVFKNGNNKISVYNNTGNGTIAHSVMSGEEFGRLPPNDSNKVLAILKSEGESSPYSGGFYFGTPTRKKAKFITRIIAYIPSGYTLSFHTNAAGENSKNYFATDVFGTGDFKEYIHILECGDSGVFSSTSFFAIKSENGNDLAAINWGLAYASVFDMTANSEENVNDAKNAADEALNNQSNGNLTISANTTFDGKATFISAGSSETTIIRDGSISFTRNGQTITTIRNMRSGSIATDGNGSGYVDFTGMKNNLIILPSIKGFNVSANVRSINCRVEKDPNYLAQNRYKFFVYGTEEVYEGTIKSVSYSSSWGVESYSASIDGVGINVSSPNVHGVNHQGWTVKWVTDSIIESTIIGIKTYIDGAYYGETQVELGIGVLQRFYEEPNTKYRLNLSGYLVNLGSVIKTTDKKTWKSMSVSVRVIRGGKYSGTYRIKVNGQSDYNTYTYKYDFSSICSTTFAYANYSYSPSYIQNIVGGGEVQYLAIEQ